jgi:hypothetical protein
MMAEEVAAWVNERPFCRRLKLARGVQVRLLTYGGTLDPVQLAKFDAGRARTQKLAARARAASWIPERSGPEADGWTTPDTTGTEWSRSRLRQADDPAAVWLAANGGDVADLGPAVR